MINTELSLEPANPGTRSGSRLPRELLRASDEYAPLAPAAHEGAPQITPQLFLNAFRRRWFSSLFLGMFFAVLVAALAWRFVPAPYEAFSELRVSSVSDKFVFDSIEEQAKFEIRKQTQMKLATSPFVLNAALRDPEIANLALFRDEEHPVHWLEKELVVETAGTEFFRILLKGEQPAEIAAVVAAVTQAYVDEVVTAEQEKRQGRLADLDRAHRASEEQLRTKRRTLKGLSDSLQAANKEQANLKKQYLLELAIQMRRELAEVELKRMELNAELLARGQDPEAAAAGEEETLPEPTEEMIGEQIALDPKYKQAETHVDQLAAYEAQCKERFSPNHPRIADATRKLSAAREELDRLRDEVRPAALRRLELAAQPAKETTREETPFERQIAVLDARKKQLEAELDAVRIEDEQTGALSFELTSLENQIAQSEKVAQQIAEQSEQLRVELPSPVGISIHRKAEVPFERNNKMRLAATGVGGLGGFAFIAGGIILLELRSRRVSALNEVTDDLGLRVVGTIPTLPGAMHGKKRSNGRWSLWQSILAESIDSTRTMLMRDAKVDSLRAVMVASAMSGEGKTTLASHLATSIARTGRRVVLLDCDLRRPSIHRVFDIPLSPGLSELLRGEAALDDVVKDVASPGLRVIPAGAVDSDALQELAHDAVAAVVEELRHTYDFVLIDSSPLLPVADSLLIAQHVDGVVFSIRRDVSRVHKVSAACQRLQMLGVPVLGAVAIGLDEGGYGYHRS